MQTASYAAGKSLSADGMQLKEIKIEKENLKKHFEFIKKEGDCQQVTPPKEAAERADKKIIIYKTLNVATKRIEVAEVDEMEECLNEIKDKRRRKRKRRLRQTGKERELSLRQRVPRKEKRRQRNKILWKKRVWRFERRNQSERQARRRKLKIKERERRSLMSGRRE
uniref:Uncharacterized protein n=1 Tax=Octopus bimaculoides TaxID=37653 RepID=A0A0L8I779_OCTBM